MWKAAVGQKINLNVDNDDDDWETDPDFVNDVNEQEQRWGSATIEGSGRTAGAINMTQLIKETEEADALNKKKELLEGSHNPSFGYGGKFGVEKDRMDHSAVGHEYVSKVEKHASQKDYSAGFGGKFGVQTDRVDKSAVSWDHKEKIEKHASQKDYVSGFGGKFGVQTDRQDKSAVGWDYMEKVEKHESQKDYAKGFGGKFGVQTDRQDKSAVGWDHHEAPQKHESQTDHKIGFGGKFGLQTDRVDKSAVSFVDEEPSKVGTNYVKVKPDIGGTKASDLRAKFETMHVQDNQTKPERVRPTKKMYESKTTPVPSIDSTPQEKIHPKTVESVDASPNLKQQQEEATSKQDSVNIAMGPTDSAMEKTTSSENTNKAVLSNLEEAEAQLKKATDLIISPADSHATIADEPAADDYSQEEIIDTGVSAIALYDYQAAADDEISFDPDDVITHIEKIDEGWWRGLCKDRYGLFPANYVQVTE